MAEETQAVRVEHAYLPPMRHPIKAARLLYSAPGWVLRGPIHIIAAITLISLVYSFWAKKDELVVAPLKLERETFTMEAVSSGMVNRVLINEGDRVESQDPLLEVHQTRVANVSEQDTIRSKLDDLRKQRQAQEEEFDHKRKQFSISMDQLKLSLINVDKERMLLEQQMSSAQRNVAFLEGKLGDARKELGVEQKLFNQRDITKAEYDRVKNQVDDLEKSMLDARTTVDKTRVSLAGMNKDKINNDIKQLENEIAQAKVRYETQSKRLQEQIETEEKNMKESQGLVQGVSSEGLTTNYRSTFSGLVTQMHVKPGHMISSGTPLVTIVKESAALVARVLVQNKDIGRLKRGQVVQLKYFAYPYQEYGIPTGVISEIATKPGGVTGQESMYVVKVALNEETIAKMGQRARRLEIGLEGVAEIKTGEKRFIELLFSPISRFFTQEDA